jgi:YD repeat-containing protein
MKDFVIQFAVFAIALVSVHATEPGNPWKSPGWEKIEEGLGSIALDGTLRKRYPIEETSEMKLLGLHCVLEHRIETDAYGEARSVWRIPALLSYVVPDGRDKLLWQSSSQAVRFEKAQIGRALSAAGSDRWRIRETAPGDYEIRSLDGRGYRYVRGVLVSMIHPALGELRITAQGGLIREIRRQDRAADTAPLLRADYDERGHCLSLQLGEAAPHIFIWDRAGQLQTWTRPDGAKILFAYRGALLSQITENEKPPSHYRWEPNPGYGHAGSPWHLPVHLSSDGTHDYSYNVASTGFMVEVSDRITGQRTTTVFNPRRRRMEQRGEAVTTIAVFQASGEGMKLERIETGKGEISEAYQYGPSGRLISMKRRGEPERTLSYDESGRVMAMDEPKEP